ncbi:MAG: hypothetical protein K9N07_10350 [Candidatus Cloacimonetes bacterium]|nr:hypothetical protein [Candidatus Cloacimonadota bacterium]MCF8012740.1 hypothetical protein [Candidatus Woesearchaeota archaeon]
MKEISPTELIELMKNRFETYADKLEDRWEKEYQLEIADSLLNIYKKVFMEYPYPKSKDECDIVVTNDSDCYNTKIWIEIKPVWSDSNYWSPSKFFEEAPFKKDIEKLWQISKKGKKAWFFLIIFNTERTIDISTDNPKKRKSISISQLIKGISYWAFSKKFEHRVINMGDKYCHLILYDVKGYNNKDITIKDNEYVLDI